MAEVERPRIGLRTGLQAGAFIGLFLGFSLAVVSALTQPDELLLLVQLMCITPVGSAILLGPFYWIYFGILKHKGQYCMAKKK